MKEVLLLIVGLSGLWFGTGRVIKAAINISDFFGFSQLFIGIAVLAIGTDLPEMVIAINASLQDALTETETSGIVIGTSIGSSFAQITLVLGIVGLIDYLTLTKRHLYEDGTVLLGAVLLIFVLGFDGNISSIEGIALVLVYLIYYLTLFHSEKVSKRLQKKINRTVWKDMFMLMLGMVIVIITSELVVDNAILIADRYGLRQSFVGIILIGLGTSLPELALSLGALREKAASLSVGNIIGSNIFDLLVPLGLGSSISEIEFDKSLVWFDLPFLFVVTFMALFFFYKKKGLQKIEATLLICAFVLYASLKVAGV